MEVDIYEADLETDQSGHSFRSVVCRKRKLRKYLVCLSIQYIYRRFRYLSKSLEVNY